MIYITGDKHGRFREMLTKIEEIPVMENDYLIIAGDAGINYYGDRSDSHRKTRLNNLGFPIVSVHGNHENRPTNIKTYREKEWNGGQVYYEPRFPNLIFPKDGEIFTIEGRKIFLMGGAYSVDKDYRLVVGYKWWSDEQPSEELKANAIKNLTANKWKVDIAISHTAPERYEPKKLFMPGLDQSAVDKTTEKWLDTIEKKLHYKKWYFAHYHGDFDINRKVHIVYHEVFPI